MATNLTTNYKMNFTKAENELFSWDSSFPDYLTYKPTGKQVYQMMWYAWKNSQPITEQSIRNAVSEFWTALQEMQKASDKARRDAILAQDDEPEEHGFDWCDKCQSYCYGDCEAN